MRKDANHEPAYQIIRLRGLSMPPITVKELAAQLGCHISTAKVAAFSLVDEGRVAKVVVRAWGKQKGYCLPDHPMVPRGHPEPLKPINVQQIIEAANDSRSPLERYWSA